MAISQLRQVVPETQNTCCDIFQKNKKPNNNFRLKKVLLLGEDFRLQDSLREQRGKKIRRSMALMLVRLARGAI